MAWQSSKPGARTASIPSIGNSPNKNNKTHSSIPSSGSAQDVFRAASAPTKLLTKFLIAPHSDWKIDTPSDILVFPVAEQNRDIYTEEFSNKTHVVLLGLREGKAFCVVVIEKNPSIVFPNVATIINLGPSYRAVLINKDGYEEFYLYNVSLSHANADAGAEFAEYLNKRSLKDTTFYHVTDQNIKNDLLQLEQKHSLRVNKMKVAVLYAKEGQTDIKDIFANQPPEDSGFWKFIEEIGDKIDMTNWTGYRGDMGKSGTDVEKPSYFAKWNDVDIMFHLAPYMDAEQHRRLVGNDIAVIIYYDCHDITKPFVPFGSMSMGIVPHVFAVVQPHSRGGAHRLGFFSRSNVQEHGPPNPPPHHYFDISTLRNYLLTKLYNGYAKARSCPPMKTLFTKPRGHAIEDLQKRYPKGGNTPSGLTKTASIRFGAGAKTSQREKFFIKVTAVSGRNLASKDSNGLSDPYLKMHLGSAPKRVQKTSIQYKTLSPEWKQSFFFELTKNEFEITDLNVTCMDHDDLGSDDYMGSFSLYLKDLPLDGNSRWYALTSTTGDHVSGELCLSFEKVATK